MPVLKYWNGSAYVELPGLGAAGPAGPAGPQGPQGIPGIGMSQAEADARYLTPAAGDSLFLTPVEADALFVTPAEADAAYVSLSGDTMTNDLKINGGLDSLWVSGNDSTGVRWENTIAPPGGKHWRIYVRNGDGKLVIRRYADDLLTGTDAIAFNPDGTFVHPADTYVASKTSNTAYSTTTDIVTLTGLPVGTYEVRGQIYAFTPSVASIYTDLQLKRNGSIFQGLRVKGDATTSQQSGAQVYGTISVAATTDILAFAIAGASGTGTVTATGTVPSTIYAKRVQV